MIFIQTLEAYYPKDWGANGSDIAFTIFVSTFKFQIRVLLGQKNSYPYPLQSDMKYTLNIRESNTDMYMRKTYTITDRLNRYTYIPIHLNLKSV